MTREQQIFVLFAGGSGGNFISNLMKGLLKCNTDLEISDTGNAHDYTINNNPYSVTRSHAFNELPHYRLKYPNGKFCTITTDTIKEKLVTALMRPQKYMLGKNSIVEYSLIISYKNRFEGHLRSIDIDDRVIKNVVDKFISARFDPNYRNLFVWLQVWQRYKSIKEREDDFYEIPCGDISDCIKLPFSIILNHDTPALITIIQQCFDEELTDIQKEYITRNFNNYYAAQDHFLINDPDEYFRLLEESALKKLEELKNTLP